MKTMLTELGVFLRKLRIDNRELLKDMAKKMSVSPAFLSSVETGKKKVPDDFYRRFTEKYHLSGDQNERLMEAIKSSRLNIKMDLSSVTGDNRELGIALARSFCSLDQQAMDKIREAMGAVLDRRKNDTQ